MEAVQEWEEVNIKDLKKKKKQHEKHTQWLYWTEYEFLLTLRSVCYSFGWNSSLNVVPHILTLHPGERNSYNM